MIYDVDSVKCGELLRVLRRNTGLTQEQASEGAGISTRELSNIENDFHAPRFRTFLALCSLYQVPLEVYLQKAAETIALSTERQEP